MSGGVAYSFESPRELADYLRVLASRRRNTACRTQRERADALAEARGLEEAAQVAEASTFNQTTGGVR